MALIRLTSGWKRIPEGNHIFRIEKVNYDEEFGKLTVDMVIKDGTRHMENFYLLDANGEPKNSAMNAFSFFAKTALNDFEVAEVDPQELVGKYIRCEVIHTVTESKKNPGHTVTFVNLGDKSPASSFDDDGESIVGEMSLDDLLND